jgi:cation transport ATPase
VDETDFGGIPGPVRRTAGDPILAGSRLLAGVLDLEVLRTGKEIRAARIAAALMETAKPPPRVWALNHAAEEFAERAVAPTLLAAGAGLAIGGVATAGAILRADYATGIGLAGPLETLRDLKLAVRHGCVVRTGDALARLAMTSWIVLDDHEELHRAACEVDEIRTHRLDETRLLPAAAAAGVWFGDERGPALARACRERGLIIRRTALHEIDSDGVAVGYGGHVVRLRGRSICGATAPPPLIVEVDGIEAGSVRFLRNGRLASAAVVRRLQRRGLRVFLVSEQAADAAALLAQQLGVDRHSARMTPADKVRVLGDLRRQATVAYVGDGLNQAPVTPDAHLSIAVGGAHAPVEVGLDQEQPDILLLAPSIAPLPALFALAQDKLRRIERARYAVIAPNLFSVAGAFALGFSGMAVVIISNLGTSIVYNRAKRSLRLAANSGAAASEAAWEDDGESLRLTAVASKRSKWSQLYEDRAAG